MFCEVERSYIEDGFNLYGLRACVSNFSDCLDLILDRIGPDDSDDSHLTQSACTLYGLIHARYIITAHGLDAMYNKVRKKRRELIVLSLLLKGVVIGRGGASAVERVKKNIVLLASRLVHRSHFFLSRLLSFLLDFSMPPRNLEPAHWHSVPVNRYCP